MRIDDKPGVVVLRLLSRADIATTPKPQVSALFRTPLSPQGGSDFLVGFLAARTQDPLPTALIMLDPDQGAGRQVN